MTIAIMGGTGYLGAKLMHIFADKKIRTVCIKRSNSDCSRLSDIENKIEYCLSDDESLKKFFSENEVDFVINTSCSYIKKNTKDETVIESNFTFPLRVLEKAVESGVKNFISVGSILPNDFNVYTIAKDHFNEYGKHYVKTKGISFVNLEISNFYGKNEPEDRFIPYCISKLKRNENLELTAGTQKRDFIHIDDVTRLFVHLINNYCNIIKDNGLYIDIPVGSGEAVSIREVVEHLKFVSQSSSLLDFGAIPMRAEETDCVVDISLLNKIGFIPEYYWKDGLKTILVDEK